jgi:hypothetical protein
VGIFAYNCVEFLEAMLACYKIRAVPLNINFRYVGDELGYLLENGTSRHSCSTAPWLFRLRIFLAGHPSSGLSSRSRTARLLLMCRRSPAYRMRSSWTQGPLIAFSLPGHRTTCTSSTRGARQVCPAV